LRLGDEAYGVTIRAELADRAGRDVAPGAMYTALDRLEDKGLIASRMSDPTPQRGGCSFSASATLTVIVVALASRLRRVVELSGTHDLIASSPREVQLEIDRFMSSLETRR